MDTTTLKYFMEIASGQTFWDVSENYNISQSSVSKAIARLEDELGVKLFSRSKRAVRLTPAGSMFYESLQKLEPEFNQVLLNLARNDEPFKAYQILAEGGYDFVISHLFHGVENSCDFNLVYPDTLLAIFPMNHPLANRESIDFREIFNEQILVRSNIIQYTLSEICDALSLPAPPRMKVFNMSSSRLRRDHIISQVAFGHGITLYFQSDTYIFKMDHVHVCPVTGCPEFPIVLARAKGKNLTPWQNSFRHYICEMVFPSIPGSPS